jgi:hypothetical protein
MVAGAGLGIGPDTTIGKVLLLMSPATSVVSGACLFFAHARVRRWLEDKEAEQARADLKMALEDPDVSEEDKQEFKRLLSGYHRDRIERQLRRVRSAGESGASIDPPTSGVK